MTDWFGLALALLVGVFLGGFFFIGLWWTVQKGVTAKQPAVLFLFSLLLRVGVTVVGFYWVAQGDYQRLLASVIGFVGVKWFVTHSSQANKEKKGERCT